MATYWGGDNDCGYTYCYGYYAGQYYDSGSHTGYSIVGDSSTSGSLSGNYYNYILSSGNWGYVDDSGSLYIKIGNSTEGYIWINVNPKRIYITYKDSESSFEKETYTNFAKYGTTATNTVKSVSDVALTAPSGKNLKGWNTATDGSGTYYNVGDEITQSASSMYKYYELTLYAIWEWNGLVRIDDGTNILTAIPYVDIGTEWVRVTPYIDTGTEWKLSV